MGGQNNGNGPYSPQMQLMHMHDMAQYGGGGMDPLFLIIIDTFFVLMPFWLVCMEVYRV
jgi:hypothetical protein